MKISRLFVTSLLVLLAGCGRDYVKPETPIKRVAVVSIAVLGSYLGPTVRTEPIQKLLDSTSDDLVNTAEEKLSTIMHVRKVNEFVATPAYREAGVKEVAVKGDNDFMTPHVNGKSMMLFTNNDREVADGTLKPEVARKLCADLKVDGVVMIYSEWYFDSAGFVPLKRAYTSNVISLWDAHGVEVFKKSVVTVGENYIGPPAGPVYVIRKNMKEWTNAYSAALDEVVTKLKPLTM